MKAMKAMKAMKSRTGVMSKGGIAEALATQHDLKKSICSKLLDTLAEVGSTEVKSNGKFVLPGLSSSSGAVAGRAGLAARFGHHRRSDSGAIAGRVGLGRGGAHALVLGLSTGRPTSMAVRPSRSASVFRPDSSSLLSIWVLVLLRR